jgi:hypothetical protein
MKFSCHWFVTPTHGRGKRGNREMEMGERYKDIHVCYPHIFRGALRKTLTVYDQVATRHGVAVIAHGENSFNASI